MHATSHLSTHPPTGRSVAYCQGLGCSWATTKHAVHDTRARAREAVAARGDDVAQHAANRVEAAHVIPFWSVDARRSGCSAGLSVKASLAPRQRGIGGVEVGMFACSRCTLVNPDSRQRCNACGELREDLVKPPRADAKKKKPRPAPKAHTEAAPAPKVQKARVNVPVPLRPANAGAPTAADPKPPMFHQPAQHATPYGKTSAALGAPARLASGEVGLDIMAASASGGAVSATPPTAVQSGAQPFAEEFAVPGDKGDGASGIDIGSMWTEDLEPSAWDRMRAAAMKSVATNGSRASWPPPAPPAGHEGPDFEWSGAEGGGEGEEGEEGEALARQRPRRTLRQALPRSQPTVSVDEAMSATERRELRRALLNSQAIQSMPSGASAPALPEAPVYRPTAAQFADPMAYIASIRQEAQRYGACKIVPPAGWRAPADPGSGKSCRVPDGLRFTPRLMPLHKLQQGVGFQMGAETTVAAYRAKADEFKEALCRHHGIALDDVEGIEALFWRIVQTEQNPTVVEYGADLDATTHASGFADDECGGWNLNRLASHPESLLRYLTSGVPGVSSPWLYVGMLFGAFCWHVEDLWMYSCNHLHSGAPKTWYTVPAAAASKFERAARRLLPSLFDDSPDLLFQLVAMLAPSDLRASGVPVYKIVQTPGSFVVTFPRAYHAGFSHGFNIAEAVNFAATDWLPFGRNAMQAARKHFRTPCFCVERLLCSLAESHSEPHVGLEPWLTPEVEAMIDDELEAREAARALGLSLQLLTPGVEIVGAPDASPTDESLTCHACNTILYLSGAVAPAEPGRCVCLRHLSLLAGPHHEMVAWQRYTNAGLRRLATCRTTLAASTAA